MEGRSPKRTLARGLRRGRIALLLAASTGCYALHPTVLGPGGAPIERVRRGTEVELQFAAPRRLVGRTASETRRLPPSVSRVRGSVQRASTDTLWIAVAEAAPPTGGFKTLSRPAVAPVVINRDVAVQERRLDTRRTALVGAALAVVLAVILVAR